MKLTTIQVSDMLVTKDLWHYKKDDTNLIPLETSTSHQYLFLIHLLTNLMALYVIWIASKIMGKNCFFQKFCLNLTTVWFQQHDMDIWRTGPWFNIKMTSYHYRKSHCGDKTILRPSYLHNGISYTSKMASLYWIRALVYFPYFSAPYDMC